MLEHLLITFCDKSFEDKKIDKVLNKRKQNDFKINAEKPFSKEMS